jgi:pimeloyl-ACP methyl ester carboxylesterase
MRMYLMTMAFLTGGTVANAERVPVSFDANGVTIHGDLHSTSSDGPAPLVVLLHGSTADRSVWNDWLPVLQRTGCSVLTLDLRGHGASTGPAEKNLPARAAKEDKRLFRAMHRDVAGAFAWLAGRSEIDLARIALVGTGAGAHVALDYAGRDRSIDAVVMLSPVDDSYGLNSAEDLIEYGQRPVLVVSGPTQISAAEALVSSGAKVVLRKHESEANGSGLLSNVPGLGSDLGSFLTTHLGASSGTEVVASISSDIYHARTSKAAQRIKPHNQRLFSSPEEAERRGLRAARSGGGS